MTDTTITPLDSPHYDQFLAKRTPEELAAALNFHMVQLDSTLERANGDVSHPTVQTVQRCMASVERAIAAQNLAPKL